MWAFVWLLQGLVASAAGVYLNSPCIRSLLRCAPFQLSLSDGKFSNAFIEDATTLNRQCRSIGPLLECMQEAVLRQCSLNISPAEKEFVKTRLFIAEICKDVDYTQKEMVLKITVYLRNAACINRERDWVIQACNPYDYVQLVNTSNLISLEGSCLFQKMLINCRQEAIHDKCGPDAADLYQRVKAVDMNLDFLCLESRDLRSPKFMLDVVINSYISLLLETLRPVLIMESSYLKDIVEVRREEITRTSTKVNVPLKRAKMPAHYVQDIAEYKWRRFGDIPIETSTESSSDDESSIDSADDEYLPVPIVETVPVSTNMDPAGDLDAVALDTVNNEAEADSRLATVEETSSNFDEIIETTGLDFNGHPSTESIVVEEEAISDSAELRNSAGSEFEQAHLNSGSSNTKVILGIHIPQFDHAEVDATEVDVVSEAIGSDLGTIQGTIMHEPSDLETSTGFEEFQGMSTLCPEYLETTVTDDVEDDRETTTQYPGHHETSADLGDVQNAALHSGDQEASSANLDDVPETSTLYSDNLETTTDDLDFLQKTTTLLYSSDYFNDAAAESDAFGKETRSELDDNEEHIFDTSLPPEITRANFGEESESSSPHSIISHLKGVEDFLSKDVKDLVENDSLKFKEFLGNLAEIAQSGEFKTPEDLAKVMSLIASGMYKYILVLSSKPGWESFGNGTKQWIDLYMQLKNYTADARKNLQAIGTDASVEKPTSKDLERATAESGSLEDLERRDRILKERINLEAVSKDTVNIEAGADSRLTTVEETSSNFGGIIETTGLDFNGHPSTESIDVEDEAISDSAEHLNSAESEFEQAHLNSGNSNTKVILGIHIPQFDHAKVDATLVTNVVSEAIGTDLGTIQGTTMHEPSDLETSTDIDEFQGIATLCPEYLETTVTDNVEDYQETTTQYPGDHETSSDLGNVQETSTLYSDNLETTTDDLGSLQKTTTILYSRDYFNDASAEPVALGKETRSELDGNEHIFDTSLPPEITRANFGEESESSSPHSIISHLKGVDDFLSKDIKDLVEDDSLKFKEFLGNLAEMAQSGKFKTPEGLAKVMSIIASGMYKYILVLSSKPGWESFGNGTKQWIDLYMHLKNYTADAREILQAIGTDASVVEKPTSKDLERATEESGSLENLERRGGISEERIQEPRDFEKELDGYVSSTVVSGVIDVLGAMFAPKKIERRSVGIPRHYIKSISPEEVEGLIHMDLPGVEFVKALVKAWDHAMDAETERLKGSTGHEKNAKFPEEPVTAFTTIKSIAELGVKLNYVLIGESYVPLEVGYVEGNEERKSNRNLKIPRRKFTFYTSTPTEPSTQLPDESEFFTTEYPPETSTDEPQSFSELDSNGRFPSDFSCPEVTGNQTPRISHLVDPEKRSRLEDCFGVLREGTRSNELPDQNPKETDQEIRRSGDVKELPEKADPRNLDMETMVALRFYAEVLTELASMLPSDSPDSKTLAKRASVLVDFFGNYLKAKKDPPGIVPPRDESRSGRIFQKRSLRAECADQEKPVDGECKKLKTDDGVRFDIGYSPESYIQLEMSYPTVTGMEDAYGVPVAKYIMMGETRLPLELHFTYQNVNYVHYAKIDIPKRSVDLKDHIALDEF